MELYLNLGTPSWCGQRKLKGKSYLITGLDRPLRLQEFEAPRIYKQSAHEGGKVVSPTHRPPLPPDHIPGTHFCQRLSRSQGHSPAGRIKLKKNLQWNRTRDLPSCSAVPHSTATLRIPDRDNLRFRYHYSSFSLCKVSFPVIE